MIRHFAARVERDAASGSSDSDDSDELVFPQDNEDETSSSTIVEDHRKHLTKGCSNYKLSQQSGRPSADIDIQAPPLCKKAPDVGSTVPRTFLPSFSDRCGQQVAMSPNVSPNERPAVIIRSSLASPDLAGLEHLADPDLDVLLLNASPIDFNDPRLQELGDLLHSPAKNLVDFWKNHFRPTMRYPGS